MRDDLILNNVNLIYLALKRLNLYHRRDEFYDIAMIGLVKGANNFDESKGYKATTYLYRCICNEILMSFRRLNSGREIPEYMLTPLETNITENLTLSDVLPDRINIEEDIIQNETFQFLYEEISKLTKQEQIVINLVFGINGHNKMKQRDICKLLHISQAQVSRVKNKAIKKLRKSMVTGEVENV